MEAIPFVFVDKLPDLTIIDETELRIPYLSNLFVKNLAQKRITQAIEERKEQVFNQAPQVEEEKKDPTSYFLPEGFWNKV